jgi:hypothetical protein
MENEMKSEYEEMKQLSIKVCDKLSKYADGYVMQIKEAKELLDDMTTLVNYFDHTIKQLERCKQKTIYQEKKKGVKKNE